MSDQIEEIKSGEKRLALVIRHDFGGEGVNFVTAPEDPFQIGVLNHAAGHEIKAHSHNQISKKNSDNREFLVVLEGKIAVTFYNGDQIAGETVLSRGDALLQIAGGHGFRIIEPTRMIEVKQGPYYGTEKEKVYIEK